MNTFFYQKSFLLIYFFFFYFEALSQNSISIPTGTWRTHFDYSNVKLISFFDNKLYASASKGVFYFDFEDNSINKVTNIDGPLKYLDNKWFFKEMGNSSEVDFRIDFELKNKILNVLMLKSFDNGLKKIADAFEKRAIELFESS